MDGLFGDGLVDVLCCGGDSLEEDLRCGPRLGALVDLVEFEDGVTNGGVALFKIVEALSGGAFFFSTSVELKTKGAGGGGAGREMMDSNTSLSAILTRESIRQCTTMFGTMDSGIKFISLICPPSFVGGSLTFLLEE